MMPIVSILGIVVGIFVGEWIAYSALQLFFPSGRSFRTTLAYHCRLIVLASLLGLLLGFIAGFSWELLFIATFSFLGWSVLYAVLAPTMVDRSLSAFMLIFIDRSENGLSETEMIAKFSPKEIFVKRLEEHVLAKAIYLKNDRYYLTTSGRRMAKFFSWMLRVFKMKENF